MTRTIRKRLMSVIVFVAMLLQAVTGFAVTTMADTSVVGNWKGSTTAANGTVYEMDLEMAEDSTYKLVISYAMGETTYHETETGTYEVDGDTVNFIGKDWEVEAMEGVFEAGNSTGKIDGENLVVNRYASFMAKSMGKDPVDITFEKVAAEDPVFEDLLEAGTYELTADSYDASAAMKLAADLIVDTDNKTFQLWRTMASGDYVMRSEGTYAFDETTGVYTISFTTPAEKTTTFTYDAETKGITFTTPLWFGSVAMNVTDEDGNFLPYTAYPKAAPVYEDLLEAGTYELTADSYDASAAMKLAADLIVDTDNKTFQLWRTMASGDYVMRSEGTYAFDETTGVYTISFTTPAEKTTTFTYDAETKGITFTTPLWFGSVAMNVTDEDGNFLPYTAYPKAEHEVTGVTLDQTEVKIPVDGTVQLTATVEPEDASDKSVTWISSNESVASVDENGLVTANHTGKAVITVSTVEGGITANCVVEVIFKDVTEENKYWYAPVYWAAENGITNGYQTDRTSEKYGTFGPEENCTREQMITFLWRQAGKPEPSSSTKNVFSDVKAGSYYYKAVLWAYEKGITKGYSSGPNKGKFGVGLSVTREDTVTFIYRMAGKPSVSASDRNTYKFSDIKSGYYVDAVVWAAKNGITKGYGSGPHKGKFGVGFNVLRKDIVTFLYRYDKLD